MYFLNFSNIFLRFYKGGGSLNGHHLPASACYVLVSVSALTRERSHWPLGHEARVQHPSWEEGFWSQKFIAQAIPGVLSGSFIWLCSLHFIFLFIWPELPLQHFSVQTHIFWRIQWNPFHCEYDSGCSLVHHDVLLDPYEPGKGYFYVSAFSLKVKYSVKLWSV